jgi:hypothetical protein
VSRKATATEPFLHAVHWPITQVLRSDSRYKLVRENLGEILLSETMICYVIHDTFLCAWLGRFVLFLSILSFCCFFGFLCLISAFGSGVIRSSFVLNVTQCIVANFSGQPVDPIFKGQAVQAQACFFHKLRFSTFASWVWFCKLAV